MINPYYKFPPTNPNGLEIIPPEYEMEMLRNGRAYLPDTWAEYYQWLVDRGYMDRNPLPFNLQKRIDRLDYPPRNIPPGMDYHIAGKDRVPKSVYEFLNPPPTPPPGMGRPMPVPPGLMPSPKFVLPQPMPAPQPMPQPKQPPVLPPPRIVPPPDFFPPQDFPPPPPPMSPLPRNPGVQPDPSGKIARAPAPKQEKPTLNSFVPRYKRS